MTQPAPQHLAFLIRALDIGGAERQLVALANGLCARGHRVSVLLLYREGALLEALDGRIEIVDLGKRHRYDLAGFVGRFRRAMARLRPDLLYSWLQVPNLIAGLASWLPGTPAIAWGVRGTEIEPDAYDFARWAVDAALRRLGGRPAIIITNAEAARQELIAHGVAAARIAVVPNGIDTGRFRPDREAGRRIRRELGLDDRASVIGMVARLDPMKDHGTLLEAAARYLPGHDAARLVVAGGGPDDLRRRLQAQAEASGISARVLWTGPRLDLPALYNAFDLCTLPSRFGEAFPNVLGEAMACGVPCVATDVGDSRAVIGECGWIVAPRSSESLARTWQEALDLPAADRYKLGLDARARIETRFGLDQMVEASETALTDAIDRHRSDR